jgi:hypothetical protein
MNSDEMTRPRIITAVGVVREENSSVAELHPIVPSSR